MTRPARIALATASMFPDGDADDAGLPEALGGAEFVVWDDPTVDWDVFDLVVIRSTWDYHHRRDAFLTWARSLGRRLVNPPAVVEWNTDKTYLGELAEAGLPVVPTAFVEADPTRPSTFRAPDYDFVVKPTVSAGSRDTARFTPEEGERAQALVAHIHASGRTAMVQPFVASVDVRGETALLFFGGVFSHAIHKGPILKPGQEPTDQVHAAEAIQPREATAAERRVAEAVVAWVARGFGAVPAYARVDLVEDVEGAPHLLELELTEPSLFFAHADGAEQRFAAAVRRRLGAR